MTFIDVIMLADAAIQRIDFFKRIRFVVDETLDQLVTVCKVIKKFVMRSLRGRLLELLPALSMEEDILDNILSYLNPLGEDANVAWKFVDTTEEDKTIMTSIYRHLSEVSSMIKRRLFTLPFNEVFDDYDANKTRPLLRGQLQRILAEIKEGEDQGVEEGQDQ